MSNEIKNQVQETEFEADGELNEEALMSVAGGASVPPAPKKPGKTNGVETKSVTTKK